MKVTYAAFHHAHPTVATTLAFFFMYSLLVVYVRSKCWRDPTSLFYQARRAHAPSYSTLRIQQASQYADSVGSGKEVQEERSKSPELCIGVASVQRDGISYLKPTLGSLQQGLSNKERARLHVVVLIAHINQHEHTDYGQPWLVKMADSLPSYDGSPERLALAEQMKDKSHAVKSKFDYSILMEECVKSRAPYVLLIEDDVVFLDGWRHRVMTALGIAISESWEVARKDFLYLRLFYYESLRGWNESFLPKYTGWCIVFGSIVVCLMYLARRYTASMRRYITRQVFFLTMLVFLPMLITLFFAAGANCVFPQPAGVHLMPTDACCGQGLVFPLSTIKEKLLPLFRNNRWSESPTDSFIEDFADATGELRWALTPVVLQHVGSKSTYEEHKGIYGTMTPNDIWNFAFEQNEATKLAEEHSLAISRQGSF